LIISGRAEVNGQRAGEITRGQLYMPTEMLPLYVRTGRKMSQMLRRQKLKLYLSMKEDVTDVLKTEVAAVSVYEGRCHRC